jgi:hypothetical protein
MTNAYASREGPQGHAAGGTRATGKVEQRTGDVSRYRGLPNLARENGCAHEQCGVAPLE